MFGSKVKLSHLGRRFSWPESKGRVGLTQVEGRVSRIED